MQKQNIVLSLFLRGAIFIVPRLQQGGQNAPTLGLDPKHIPSVQGHFGLSKISHTRTQIGFQFLGWWSFAASLHALGPFLGSPKIKTSDYPTLSLLDPSASRAWPRPSGLLKVSSLEFTNGFAAWFLGDAPTLALSVWNPCEGIIVWAVTRMFLGRTNILRATNTVNQQVTSQRNERRERSLSKYNDRL